MTVPIISHSYDGIRINIDGVTDVFDNAVQVAERYARHRATCRQLCDGVQELADALERDGTWIRGLLGQTAGAVEVPREHAAAVADRLDSLHQSLAALLEHCRR